MKAAAENQIAEIACQSCRLTCKAFPGQKHKELLIQFKASGTFRKHFRETTLVRLGRRQKTWNDDQLSLIEGITYQVEADCDLLTTAQFQSVYNYDANETDKLDTINWPHSEGTITKLVPRIIPDVPLRGKAIFNTRVQRAEAILPFGESCHKDQSKSQYSIEK